MSEIIGEQQGLGQQKESELEIEPEGGELGSENLFDFLKIFLIF